jgi:Protein of unknown function (DUF2796)
MIPVIRQRHVGLALALLMALSGAAWAQHAPHAHVHGRIQLGVAVDGAEVSVDIDTPLDSLLGFEHAPRTAAQKQLAAEWARRLRDGDSLWRFNPEAQCRLKQADLEAPVLGLGVQATPASPSAHAGDAGGHADLAGAWSFVCAAPVALRSLEVSLFKLSPHAQVIEVQWVKGARQGKQTLKRPQSRIHLMP